MGAGLRNKIVSVQEAVAIVRDGDTLACSGFGTNGVPEELALALAERFRKTGAPHNLTLFFGGGPGDGAERGLNCLALEGMLKRVIGGHFGLVPCIGKLALEGRIEAYNLPLGVISHMWRDIAQGLPGTVSRVGLGTFVDPRLEGGKINARTTEALVELIRLGGEEMLYYRAPRVQVAFIRGTTADPEGNIVMDRETLTQDTLSIATAARNSGGLVVAQVERIAEHGSLHPRRVTVPGILVDCVVIARPEYHVQTFGSAYNPAYSSEIRVPLDALAPMPLDERKIVARRAAFELVPNAVVNLGIGMPEGVASVANEERILKHMTLTAEPGVVGGVPASGLDFGAAVNPDAIIDMNHQFDFYDGGGLDLAVLGLAQCDAEGNINVSRFGPKLAGAGGFINITQNARKVVFVGTFSAGGLEISVQDGRLRILKEGNNRKFVRRVEQITFSGSRSLERPILYVTERCVFRLTREGLELTEVAPGIDIERDILAHMDFKPIVKNVESMERPIFQPALMGLKDRLLAIGLEERIRYDAARETLFYNFENLRVASRKDIEDIRAAVERRCATLGRKVDLIVNYDGFNLAEDLVGEYAAMVKDVSERFYRRVTRYTTSAFMRMKLGDALTERGLAPHIYESREEACQGI
jgi:propionate CoA-transferase